jgi:hypothetical protein
LGLLADEQIFHHDPISFFFVDKTAKKKNFSTKPLLHNCRGAARRTLAVKGNQYNIQ